MMITAHSGCDGTVDNTKENVIYALNSKADVFEVDVRFDGDKLILSHDDDYNEPFTLRETFELFKDHTEKKINCDLKEFGIEQMVYDLAKEIGVEKRLIFTGSVTADLFLKGNNKIPDVEWYMNLIEPDGRKMGDLTIEEQKAHLLKLLDVTEKYETAGTNWWLGYSDIVYEEATARNIKMSFWTVEKAEQLPEYIDKVKKNGGNLTTKLVKEATDLLGR